MEKNEVLDRLPSHLMDLVIEQPYNSYTAQDHAVWRYIMHQNVSYLPGVAHGSYLDGLAKTGISIESIPQMYGMNRILKDIGWAAVAVDGFIPPAAFMEFQSYNVLVIAADIRPITQVGYTPAPDIVHEAAGHAPIIADPEYAEYLVRFGEIGSKAFSSGHDFEIYEAIRLLSIVKADPYSTPEQVRRAEQILEEATSTHAGRSELAMIRNLHWWTVEYGLVGDLKAPKIYGAGLLSSISESFNCLRDGVKKLPYSIDAARVDFDITTQQPQLFVTPDFATLMSVLEEFAATMALKTGGTAGLAKAVDSGQACTVVYSSGLQVSGTLGTYLETAGVPVFIRFTSPVSLAFVGKELEGQGITYHKHGFSSPVGKLRSASKPLEQWTDGELATLEDSAGLSRLEFESGLVVTGRRKGVIRNGPSLLVIRFDECTVSYRNEILYKPDWGMYDMAVGEKIVSVFAGPADATAFGLKYPAIREKTHKIEHGEKERALHSHYQKVRTLRETSNTNGELDKVWNEVITRYPAEWLLPLEILELAAKAGRKELYAEVMEHLQQIRSNKEFTKLVDDGLVLVSKM